MVRAFTRYFVSACAVALACVAAPASAEQDGAHILRSQIEQMFDMIRARAQWNLDGPLRWGYFFTSADRSALERASNLLVKEGYKFVNIRQSERPDAQGDTLWWLRVERIEHHTVDSLDGRNQQLYQFAQTQGSIAYDGIEVGPPP